MTPRPVGRGASDPPPASAPARPPAGPREGAGARGGLREAAGLLGRRALVSGRCVCPAVPVTLVRSFGLSGRRVLACLSSAILSGRPGGPCGWPEGGPASCSLLLVPAASPPPSCRPGREACGSGPACRPRSPGTRPPAPGAPPGDCRVPARASVASGAPVLPAGKRR